MRPKTIAPFFRRQRYPKIINKILEFSVTYPLTKPPKTELLNVDDVPDVTHRTKHYIRNALYTPTTSYTMMEDVLVNQICGYSDTKGTIMRYQSTIQKETLRKANYSYSGSYDYVIGMCHSYTRVFGHLIFDYAPLINSLPSKALENALFAFSNPPAFYPEFLELLGVNMSNQILVIKKNTFIFIRHFIQSKKIPYTAPNIYSLKKLSWIFWKKLNLSNEKPFRFLIIDRGKRTIPNRNLFGTVAQMFPDIHWEIFKHTNQTFIEIATLFHETKLLWGVHGSHQGNMVFMQPGTVISIINFGDFNRFYVVPAMALGIHHVVLIAPGLSQKTIPNYPYPLHLIKTHIETGLRILEQEGLGL